MNATRLYRAESAREHTVEAELKKEELERLRNWHARAGTCAEKCDYDQAVILAEEIIRSAPNHGLGSAAGRVCGACKPVRKGSGSDWAMQRAHTSLKHLQTVIEEVIEK